MSLGLSSAVLQFCFVKQVCLKILTETCECRVIEGSVSSLCNFIFCRAKELETEFQCHLFSVVEKCIQEVKRPQTRTR